MIAAAEDCRLQGGRMNRGEIAAVPVRRARAGYDEAGNGTRIEAVAGR
jgi:hypothetical protein